MRCQEESGTQTSTVYQKRRTGDIAGKWQLLARQRSSRPCRSRICLEAFAEGGATLAGAGPAPQDRGGSRLRGVLGGRMRSIHDWTVLYIPYDKESKHEACRPMDDWDRAVPQRGTSHRGARIC